MGFFFEEQSRNKTKPKKHGLSDKTLHEMRCKVCPLDTIRLHHPKMKPTGSDNPLVYMLGEAPGETEDRLGEQFVGDSGEMIRGLIPSEYKRKLRWNNTLRCRPPGNRDPVEVETECCRMFQVEDIQRTKPKVIIAIGLFAIRWCIPSSPMTKAQGVGAWRGRLVPAKIGTHVCWIYPVAHPSGILRKGGARSQDYDFLRRDMEALFEMFDNDELPKPTVVEEGYSENIELFLKKDVGKLTDRLTKFVGRVKEGMTIDIECTNLRPYKKGSRIVACSITDIARDETLAFPVDHPVHWGQERKCTDALQALGDCVLRSTPRKTAQNLGHELEWFGYFFGDDVVLNNKWDDTLSQGYVLDHRIGMHNLDTLVRLYFGFWLKALSKIDFSNLLAMPVEDVLVYNGMDSRWTAFLRTRQVKRLLRSRGSVGVRLNQHFVHVAMAKTIAQLSGIPLHRERAEELADEFDRKLEWLEHKARMRPEWEELEQRLRREPNLNAPDDMGVLFADILGVKDAVTEKGAYTTAEEVIGKLNPRKFPMAPILLKYRSIRVIRSTFLDEPWKHWLHDDGLIHTSYNSTVTATTRLSSDDPNAQNFPKREYKQVRSMIAWVEYKKGELVVVRKVVSADYAQIEARVLACASEDQAYCDALWSESDVHAEWAEMFAEEDVDLPERHGIDIGEEGGFKAFRNIIKNKWVFPLFYGSWEDNVIEGLYVDERVGRKLHKKFLQTFKGIFAWHDRQFKFYDKHGYVETLTGFRRYGPFGKHNEPLNTPIQGTAAHICNDAWYRCTKAGYRIPINVHDDLTQFMREGNLEEHIPKIARIMTEPQFDFIIVPLVVEFEVGNDWANKTEFGKYSSTQWGHKR